MNLEEMLKNMNPQMLSGAISQMGKFLTPEQLQQVQQAIASTEKGALNQKLNHLGPEDLKRELQKNPALAKELANNPEIMQKINQIFGKK
ncbi:MAG: hypothetical protein J6A56_03385 [Clostridia bacterium]|nr:hypothetical protein [Clostridia bacterium]